jgi:asparagine synthase (glutamine-hydrolysing)
MCGIAGYLDLRGTAPPSQDLLRQMLAVIRHRGPDQFGIYVDDAIGMANARLSIVDLASGQQPISTEDERFWIVYNGEIFNHHELRRELEDKGHHFETSCDTEVFLHLYEQEGPSCLKRLNGQFAVAIWDSVKQELFIARDRLGVRPLFYCLQTGIFLFGSEIKALAVHPVVDLQINPVALDQVFTTWSCLPPGTIFRGINQLPAGHYALISREGFAIKRYWQPFVDGFDGEAGSLNEAASEERLTEIFRELLADSTRLRLLADVPVGAYLSGGLDSSIIAALIRRHATGRLDTFSIAFTDSAYDESGAQRRMAQYLGTDHQVLEASHEDIGEVFPAVVWHCETPLLRTAPAPMFLLSRLVRRSGYKVVLTGEGADEFLAGYDIFKEAKIRAFWSHQPDSTLRPKLLRRLYPDLQALAKLSPKYLSSFFGDRLTEEGASDYSHAIRWRNTRRIQRFFSNDLADQIHRKARPILDSVQLPEDFRRWDLLRRAQYLEVVSFLSNYLLSSQGDRVAMAHSVEGRFPFLDPRVVQFADRLPSKFKLRGLRDKYLLRKVGLGLLPDETSVRPKKPYRAPIFRCFFHAKTPAYVKDILSETALRESGLFRFDAVSKLVAKIEQGQSLGETDDMAVAGIISSQLIFFQFVKDFRKVHFLSDREDIKLCDRKGRFSRLSVV